MFSSLDIAGTGMDVSQTWLNAISDNIANVNTVRPTSQAAYQTRYIEAQPIGGTTTFGPGAAQAAIGSGVAVSNVVLSSAQGQLVYDPTSPMADASGMVRGNQVDLGEQMSELIMAQRGYQANISTIKSAQQAYQAALGLKL